MRQLFFRFYLGVLLILMVAWAIQTRAFRDDATPATEDALIRIVSGGARLARESLEGIPDGEERTRQYARLNTMFSCPVHDFDINHSPQFSPDEFAVGKEVVTHISGQRLIYGILSDDGSRVLTFGHLPLSTDPPSQLLPMIRVGSVLLVSAIAIAVLALPVSNQLQSLEKTATAIAAGKFDARVPEHRVPAVAGLGRSFNTMADKVQRLLRTQRELLQVVSHELRTPLSRIHFAIDLIDTAETDQERTKRLDTLTAAADELDTLVADLLQYVKIETGQLEIEREELPLRPHVEELLEELAPLRPTIRFEIGENLRTRDVTVLADRRRSRQVLGNLLQNAGRFAKSRVRIDATTNADGIVVTIDDDGPGIEDANRARVFEPFVRFDDSAGGSGLGLALVHRMVLRRGGRIRVTDSPLGGARFEMTIPRQVTPHEDESG